MKLPSLPLLVGHNQETEDYRLITHEIDSGFLFIFFFSTVKKLCALLKRVLLSPNGAPTSNFVAKLASLTCC